MKLLTVFIQKGQECTGFIMLYRAVYCYQQVMLQKLNEKREKRLLNKGLCFVDFSKTRGIVYPFHG